MMVDNNSIESAVSVELAKHFAIDVEKALARSISKISDNAVGFTLFGTGVSGSYKKVTVENNTSWQERAQILEDLIVAHLDEAEYFIIFDELDEDYRDILEKSVSRNYLDLLTGLFKATQDVRRKVSHQHHIRPLVFLRSDIYDLIHDNDKNKWRDSALNLTWSEPNLRDLTAYRLSRARAVDGVILTFNDVIDELFTTDTTRAGGARRQRHVFAYILAYTLMRPRDVISYLRECARFALENGNGKISPNRFSEVNRAYSLRLRQEFVDEMQGAIPFIEEIFEIMARMRKQVFSFSEFQEQYDAAVADGDVDAALGFRTICRVLFHYSAIGNQPSQRSAKIFQYVYPNARINFSENVVIHRGLLQSLQIN